MYYPYFRGKQFELLTIRENAVLLAASKFTPVVEPVRELRGLSRALGEVCDASGEAIVIVNPHYGHHSANGDAITDMLRKDFAQSKSVHAGILLTEDCNIETATDLYRSHQDHSPSFIHAGFTEAKDLSEALADFDDQPPHIFFELYCPKLYRRHFHKNRRVLLRDGFKKRRNADHPKLEAFSELHITFEDEGVDGFGDFSIVGDDFTEGGGPAYAVAIHLTYIDEEKDGQMFIRHFVSATRDTPTDPAGKFGEALGDLAELANSNQSKFYKTEALSELLALHDKGHFPGLGYVKKLSMKHHIETLATFFETRK